MVKKLILIFLIIFSNFYFINCSNLVPEQLEAANKIIQKIYNKTIEEGCDTYGSNFVVFCNHEFGKNSTIREIHLFNGYYFDDTILKENNILGDELLVLKDLEEFGINSDKIHLTSNFFDNLYKFEKLEKLTLSDSSTLINDDIKLPKSLKFLELHNFGGNLAAGFFNGNLEKISICGIKEGFNYTKGDNIKENWKLFELTIPLIPKYMMQPLFNNLGKKLKQLEKLNIEFSYSDYLKINSSKYDKIKIPNFKALSFPSLYQLKISTDVENPPDIQFPHSIKNLQNLKRLLLSGNSFVFDEIEKKIDFSPIQNGLFFENSKNCFYLLNKSIKLPKGSFLSIQNCDFNVNELDLTNIDQVSISGNNYYQTYPTKNINNYKQFKLFSLHGNFKGEIPKQYSQFKKGVLSVESYNQIEEY